MMTSDMLIGRKELIGKIITDVRPLTNEEKEEMFDDMWGIHDMDVAVELDGEILLVPAQDSELNGIGALLAFNKEGGMQYVYENKT